MVFSAPAAHHSQAHVTGWIDETLRYLERLRDGVIVRVADAHFGALGALTRALARQYPDLLVTARADRVLSAPVGSTVLCTPQAHDAAAYNVARSVFRDRRLRVVLWTDGETGAELRQYAPDFMDWVSLRVQCPDIDPPFWAANLRAAVRAGAPGVTWQGPGSFDRVLHAAFPSATCQYVDLAVVDLAGQRRAKTLAELTDDLAPDGVQFSVVHGDGVDDPVMIQRIHWALATVGRRRRVVFAVGGFVHTPYVLSFGALTAASRCWILGTRQRYDWASLDDGSASAGNRMLLGAITDLEESLLDRRWRTRDSLAESNRDRWLSRILDAPDAGKEAFLLGMPPSDWQVEVLDTLPAHGWTAAARAAVNSEQWTEAFEDRRQQVVSSLLAGRRIERPELLEVFATMPGLPCTASLPALVRSRIVPAGIAVERRLREDMVTLPEAPMLANLARRAGDVETARAWRTENTVQRWAGSTAGFEAAEWWDEATHALRLDYESGNHGVGLERARFARDRAEVWDSGRPPEEFVLLLAELLASFGEFERARELLDGMSGAHTDESRASAQILRAYIAVWAGEPDLAGHRATLGMLVRGLSTSPDIPLASRLRSWAIIASAWTNVADEHYAEARRLADQAVGRFEGLSPAFDSGHVRGLLALANAHRELGAFEESERCAERALAAAKPRWRHPLALRATLELARLDRARGRYDRVRRRLENLRQRYEVHLPGTYPDRLVVQCELDTLALVESRHALDAKLARAERSLEVLARALSVHHYEVRRYRAIVEGQRHARSLHPPR